MTNYTQRVSDAVQEALNKIRDLCAGKGEVELMGNLVYKDKYKIRSVDGETACLEKPGYAYIKLSDLPVYDITMIADELARKLSDGNEGKPEDPVRDAWEKWHGLNWETEFDGDDLREGDCVLRPDGTIDFTENGWGRTHAQQNGGRTLYERGAPALDELLELIEESLNA